MKHAREHDEGDEPVARRVPIAPPTFPILDLFPELRGEVILHLDVATRRALHLTCKQLYANSARDDDASDGEIADAIMIGGYGALYRFTVEQLGFPCSFFRPWLAAAEGHTAFAMRVFTDIPDAVRKLPVNKDAALCVQRALPASFERRIRRVMPRLASCKNADSFIAELIATFPHIDFHYGYVCTVIDEMLRLPDAKSLFARLPHVNEITVDIPEDQRRPGWPNGPFGAFWYLHQTSIMVNILATGRPELLDACLYGDIESMLPNMDMLAAAHLDRTGRSLEWIRERGFCREPWNRTVIRTHVQEHAFLVLAGFRPGEFRIDQRLMAQLSTLKDTGYGLMYWMARYWDFDTALDWIRTTWTNLWSITSVLLYTSEVLSWGEKRRLIDAIIERIASTDVMSRPGLTKTGIFAIYYSAASTRFQRQRLIAALPNKFVTDLIVEIAYKFGSINSLYWYNRLDDRMISTSSEQSVDLRAIYARALDSYDDFLACNTEISRDQWRQKAIEERPQLIIGGQAELTNGRYAPHLLFDLLARTPRPTFPLHVAVGEYNDETYVVDSLLAAYVLCTDEATVTRAFTQETHSFVDNLKLAGALLRGLVARGIVPIPSEPVQRGLLMTYVMHTHNWLIDLNAILSSDRTWPETAPSIGYALRHGKEQTESKFFYREFVNLVTEFAPPVDTAVHEYVKRMGTPDEYATFCKKFPPSAGAARPCHVGTLENK